MSQKNAVHSEQIGSSSIKHNIAMDWVIDGYGDVQMPSVVPSKKEKDAVELAKMNAVHGVLFKGIAATSGTAKQPALVKPQEQENNQDFFENFFDNGTYQRYVSLSSDGVVDPQDRMKVGKEYKIGIIVSVNTTDLRRYLESEGIIKGFRNMF